MSEMHKHYQILGLKPGASEKEIVEAYKVLVKVWNPDRFSDDPNLQKIATEKIREIDGAFKQLLIWTGCPPEKGKETTEPQLKIGTEPLGTRGSIVVKTDPIEAIVHFNGKPVGNSPIRGKNLSVGSYNIRVIKDGYEIWEQDVDIYAGAEKEVVAKLKLKEPESGETWKDPYLGMEFVYVKGGRFEMGDIFGDGNSDEKPVHEVQVNAFYIGKHLVTQGEWKELMGNNPSGFRIGDNYPVEQVNWYDVEEFINRLNERTEVNFRLPTEAEWEYAARSGGKKEKWAGISDESELTEYAWYCENSGNEPHQVGRRKANGLGVYDISGNVWEWVKDWYDKDYYRNSPTDNPQCKQLGYTRNKVIRGGMFQSGPMPLRTTSRASIDPRESHGLGFRLVLPAQPEQPVKREKEQPITLEGKTHRFLSQNYIPAGTPTPSLQEPLYEPSSKPLPGDDLKRSTEQVVVSPHIVEYAGIEEVQNPEISGLQIRPWVRYWARLMDLFLFCLLSGLVLGIIYPPALKINEMLFAILLLFVYAFVEPIMLTSAGTTPGKALLRVRLRKSNGSNPTYAEALGRSVSVWVGGWGFGIPIVSLITLIIAYNKLKKDGITTWDGGRDFNVSHRQIGAIRVIITVLIFISYIFLIVLGEKSKG